MNIENPIPATPGNKIQVLAGFAAILPMGLIAIWMHLVRDSTPGISEFFLGPLLAGGGMIFWLLFLHSVVCRDKLGSLGFGIGGFWRDIGVGLVLGAGFLLLKSLTDPLLSGLFHPRPPSPEIIRLIVGVASNTWLLALWLGPVVWIGIAGFEELFRVVVLRRFWMVTSNPPGMWLVIILVSFLIGLAHGYQGPAAIISIGIKSVLMGWYFMVTRRTRPLIVSHAVYDSIQIVTAVLSIRGT